MPKRDAFDYLPIEMLLKIFSYLSPEELASTAHVNQQFHHVATYNALWHKKFKQHFPHLTVAPTQGINWYQTFRTAYSDEYEGLPIRLRELFSLVKEDANIDSYIIKLSDSDQTDKSHHSLLDWANLKNNQKCLDHFYQLALAHYKLRLSVYNKDQQKRTILHWAVLCHQQVDTIISLIHRGSNVNAVTEDGATPLQIAIVFGRLDLVNALLAKKANIDATGEHGVTPLHVAAHCGKVAVVNALLANNAKIDAAITHGPTPLYIAAQNGHLDVVNALMAKNANIDACGEYNETPLYIAAQNGHLDVVNALLARDVNIDAGKDNETPLYIAAKNGHLAVVKALLAKSASINLGKASETPLHIAAQNGHLDVVNALLANNANIDAATEYDATPLYIAAYMGHLNVVNVLLANNAKINNSTHVSERALLSAVLNGHLDVVKALLAKDANIYVPKLTDGARSFIAGQMLRLIIYSAKTNARPDNHYKKSFTLFGCTKNFGCSAKQKKAAANALMDVLFNKKDISCLDEHQEALNNGELKSIYKSLKLGEHQEALDKAKPKPTNSRA